MISFLRKGLAILLFGIPLVVTFGQEDSGRFSGALEANGNIFIRDEEIGAAGIPQYDHQLFGAESWLNLNYSNWGFDIGVRFDLFNNSNLLNPSDSYTDQGIGRWYIKKSVDKLGITVGYIYDQIGSGIIFRTYEERPLLIDNALFGIRLSYDLAEDWQIKAFTGRNKKQFDTHDPFLTGISLEGFIAGKEGSNWSVAPGFGFVNRTYDDQSMEKIVNVLTTYVPEDRVKPTHNAYFGTIFNTLTSGNFSWFVEAAYHSDDVFEDPTAVKQQISGGTSMGKLVRKNGSVLYTSLSYSNNNGLGITLEAKRTEDFRFRVDPFQQLNDGLISFIPPMFRQNTYRLNSRYSPATQDLGEQAYQIDIRYSPNRKWSFLLNIANINDLNLDKGLLYREIFTEVIYKYERKWQLTGGVQYQEYNQDVYQGKPGVPMVVAITPYAEFLYKFDKKKALRTEIQYMKTDEDFGSWLWVLAEFSIAPSWIFVASDMYNVSPAKTDKLHYPSFGVVYNNKSNRFGVRWVKQVEGIICSGGICRLEPAFSGVKMTVNSTF